MAVDGSGQRLAVTGVELFHAAEAAFEHDRRGPLCGSTVHGLSGQTVIGGIRYVAAQWLFLGMPAVWATR
jgi:hypothetical protein